MTAFRFDAAIVRRFSQGDRDALARLYDMSAASAYAIALFVCTSPRRAEEAVTRTYLDLWERRESLNVAGIDFAAHFYAALRRQCRRLRTRARDEASGRIPRACSPVGILRELPPEEKEALILVWLRGYSEHEASRAIGAPPETVRRLIRRGLERMSEIPLGEADAR